MGDIFPTAEEITHINTMQQKKHLRSYQERANCILQLKDQVHIVTIGLLCVEQEIISLAERKLSPSWFCGVRVAQTLVFCAVFCLSLFVFFLLTIVIFLSGLFRFTAFDYYLVSSNSPYDHHPYTK